MKTNLALDLSVATVGMRIISTKTPEESHHIKHLHDEYGKLKTLHAFIPITFHAAANCPTNDNQDIGRLFIMAWTKRMPPWKPMTTYLEAKYPPPLFPPVLSRIIT